MDNYSADKPIQAEKDDRFQRYGFSKRIAESIINRKSSESITIGLYGAWGEGKSSVLHFIDIELQKDPSVIILHFNPWRYSDEDSLLLNFFKKVATLLGRELNTKKENLGDFINKYGSIASIFGIDLGETGKIFNTAGLEDLKLRVEEFLIESNTKLVVFIDDVDRLDKNEIYSLLRLVKLTADFSNTTYILAFDEVMVASAIGERFGQEKKAGNSFLEKIIQVPLTIPKAQPEALQQLCFDLLNSALETNGILLDDSESQRFAYQFTTNLLSRLTTPRFAVRYGNSLSFSMPLLHHEVNMVDLMLIEAIKIFYPEHYYFIKTNPEYFIEAYTYFGGDNNHEKIAQLKVNLEKLEALLGHNEKEKIKDLLSNLFPYLNTALGGYTYSNSDNEKYYTEKRIGSEHYFNRYFAYTVIKGEVSDIEFKNLLDNAAVEKQHEFSDKMRELINKSSPTNFTIKLRSFENKLDWDILVLLSKGISDNCEFLPKEGKMLGFNHDSPFSQAGVFIYQVLKNNKDAQNVFELAKELMLYPKDFNFAYTLNNWFRSGEYPTQKLFTEEQYTELAKILVDRAVEEAGEDSIFNKFQEYNSYLVFKWTAIDKESFDKYVEEFLNRNKSNIIVFIKAFVPTFTSLSDRSLPSKSALNKEVYDALISYLSAEDIYNRILKVFTIEELNSEQPFWDDMGQREFTEINMVRQFVFHYNKGKESK